MARALFSKSIYLVLSLVAFGCGGGPFSPGSGAGGGDRHSGATVGHSAQELVITPVVTPPRVRSPFGATCNDSSDCLSGVCFDYHRRGRMCTAQCVQSHCPVEQIGGTDKIGCNAFGMCQPYRTVTGS